MRRVMERVNNAASAQEEQRLEEGVCEEMEHTRANTKVAALRYSQTNEHIAKLADGGEGQHTFEVGLGQGGQGRVESGDTANPRHNLQGSGVSRSEQWVSAGHH